MRNLFLLALSFVACCSMSASSMRLVVAQDGSGAYSSINEAIQAAPLKAASPVVIYIKKGVYREKVFVDRPNIVLLGEDRHLTRIEVPILWERWEREWKEAHSEGEGDVRWGCAPVNLNVDADDCSLVNLTVHNNYGSTVEKTRNHQFAVFGRATRTIIIHCDILSDGSDDVSLWSRGDGMYYHADCYFRCPGVDFVCPRGWCYVERCSFMGAAPAQLWHDGSLGKDRKFVLRDCVFDASEPSWLGRFHKDSQFYLIHCHFSEMIKDEPIGYAYKDKPMELQHGVRTYYYGCTREGDSFEWMADNLHTAEGAPKEQTITPKWTFGGRWDPLPMVKRLHKIMP